MSEKPPETMKARPGSSRKSVAAIVIVIVVVAFGALIAERVGEELERSKRLAPVNCSLDADSFQKDADGIMVDYLSAHRTGDGDKNELRERASRLSEPACARGAKAAMMDWFDAVDVDNQAGMTEADERFISALR